MPADAPLPLLSRIWFAWICWFRLVFDGDFARRVWSVRDLALPPSDSPPVKPMQPAPSTSPDLTPALQILGLLQRQGRLVDFLEQDITAFSDSDVGAAARVVHEGCRKTIRQHLTIQPIRTEQEGALVSLDDGFDPSEIKLIGDAGSHGPYRGKIVHPGWRASDLQLPTLLPGHDPSVLAPAEVEL